MKHLQLDLKKKILIVDGKSEQEAREFAYNELGILRPLKFICKGSELTEEILDQLVEKEIVNGKEFYKSYKGSIYVCASKLRSLKSAVEAKGFYFIENGIKKPNEKFNIDGINVGVDIDEAEKWQEAQSRTFSPECLIFEIV